MKKKFTLLCLALLTVLVGKAQTVYFATGFDNGMPQGVTTYDLDGRTPSTDMQKLGFEVGRGWVVAKGVDPTDTLNDVAVSTSWYKNAGAANDWMVLPAVNVNSAKAVLTFRAMARDKEYRDGFKVYISDKGGVPDSFTTAPVLTVSKEQSTWTQHSVSLAGYAGKTVYIALVNDSKDKAALYVDDIFVGVPSHVGLQVSLGRTYDGYGDVPVSFKVNAKDKDVRGFTLTFTPDNGSAPFSKTFSAAQATIASGDTLVLDSVCAISIPRNTHAGWTASVSSEGDETTLTGRTYAFPWRVVAEETTGTWCQWCVRGIGAMAWMKEHHPDGFIGIAVHYDAGSNVPDSMDYSEYIDAIHNDMGSAGYPHVSVNRNAEFYGDPANIPAIYSYIKETQTNNVGISTRGVYDAQTNTINATTDIFFSEDIAKADYKLVYVVIENNVHRTHAETGITNDYCGYDQVNAYAGGANGAMYGFESLPSIINADSIWYQDVARLIAPSYKGISNVIGTNSIKEGDHFVNTFTLDMPATVLKKENTQLVALLINSYNQIANADCVDIEGTGHSTGIHEITKKMPAEANIFYNLSGMRVEHPTKGIYICNGRKVRL